MDHIKLYEDYKPETGKKTYIIGGEADSSRGDGQPIRYWTGGGSYDFDTLTRTPLQRLAIVEYNILLNPDGNIITDLEKERNEAEDSEQNPNYYFLNYGIRVEKFTDGELSAYKSGYEDGSSGYPPEIIEYDPKENINNPDVVEDMERILKARDHKDIMDL